jgi:CHAT domain-containing protein
VPFSALYSGKEFVVEHYGVVTLPSLRLLNLDKKNHEIHTAHALLAGLSKPDGASIDQLPKNIVDGISADKMDRKMLVDELSLPSVEKEINALGTKDKSTTLINNDFTVSKFNSDIQSGDYDKVHIASHGYFGKNARESFIMSYDKNISLLDFKSTLEATNLKKQPIELLTLSACKTAEGDDRMLLGFSGLALKSNVLSAVGSLWSIHDEATMEFMKLFYEGMGRSLNKAQAMREAQISMLKNKKFKHPFFWAPFILIGNW